MSAPDTVPIPVPILKSLMELHYDLSRRHQAIAADLEAQLKDALWPKPDQAALELEKDEHIT